MNVSFGVTGHCVDYRKGDSQDRQTDKYTERRQFQTKTDPQTELEETGNDIDRTRQSYRYCSSDSRQTLRPVRMDSQPDRQMEKILPHGQRQTGVDSQTDTL